MTTNATRIDLKQAKSLAKAGLRKVNISITVLGHFMPETYKNHPCFAPWIHALIEHVVRVSVCCMMPNKPIIGDLSPHSADVIHVTGIFEKSQPSNFFSLTFLTLVSTFCEN